MNCPICNFECNDSDTICKNCGCDLPKIKKPSQTDNNANDAQKSASITAVDMARQKLLEQENSNQKIFIALKACLIAALLCFFLPFSQYDFNPIMTDDVANGLNAILGYDRYEAVEIEPETVSAFDLITTKDFKASDGSVFEITRSLYISFALIMVVAAIILCFIPMAMDLKMRIVASLSLASFGMVIYQAFQRTAGLADVKLLAGFYLMFILLLASAVISAFLKFNS